MTDQPQRVSAREISAFVAELAERSRRPLSAAPPAPAEDVKFFERKAELFTRIAEQNPEDELRQEVAAEARRQLAEVRQRQGLGGGEQ